MSDRLCLNLAAISAAIIWLSVVPMLSAGSIADAMGLHRQDQMAQWGLALLHIIMSTAAICAMVITPALVLLGIFVRRPTEDNGMYDKIWLNLIGISAATTLLGYLLLFAFGPAARAMGVSEQVMISGWGMRLASFLGGVSGISAFLTTPLLIFLGFAAGCYPSMSRRGSS